MLVVGADLVGTTSRLCHAGHMPVLCYHSVDPDWRDDIAVTPHSFARQCAWLVRTRRSIVPVTQLLTRRDRYPRAVALTFDDGFADFFDHAAPVLRAHRLPVTVYLVAKTLEDGPPRADWLRPQPPVGPPTLTRDQVLEMQDQGVEFGSHSWAHHDLRALGEAECTTDLRQSRESLEDLLGRRVSTLAYPYGFHSAHVRRAAAAAGYDYALSLPEGRESTGSFAVPRVGIYRNNGIATFGVKASRFYLSVRMSRPPGRRQARAASG